MGLRLGSLKLVVDERWRQNTCLRQVKLQLHIIHKSRVYRVTRYPTISTRRVGCVDLCSSPKTCYIYIYIVHRENPSICAANRWHRCSLSKLLVIWFRESFPENPILKWGSGSIYSLPKEIVQSVGNVDAWHFLGGKCQQYVGGVYQVCVYVSEKIVGMKWHFVFLVLR